jgi:hypothetical protein
MCPARKDVFEEGWWESEAEISVLGQEVQRLVQECNKENRNVVLLEDVFDLEGREVGRRGNNKWLLSKLKQGKNAEAHVPAKRHNLEAWLVTVDAGQVIVLGALEKGCACRDVRSGTMATK